MIKKFLLLPLLTSSIWAGGAQEFAINIENLSCEKNITGRSVRLTWTPSRLIFADGIRVSRDGIQLAEMELTETSYTDTLDFSGLEEGIHDFVYTVGLYGEAEGDDCPTLTCTASFLVGDQGTTLVLKLPMDGASPWRDTSDSANANDGIINGDVSFNSRLDGTYAQFDENAESISLGSPADLNFGAETDFTISMLVNRETFLSDDRVIAGNKDTSSSLNAGWSLTANTNGSWTWNVADGSTEVSFSSLPEVLNDGLWHCVTAVHDRDGMMTLYFDGNEVGHVSMNEIGNIDSLTTALGTDGTLTAATFLGGIDEFRVWHRRLLDDEVQTLNDTLLPHVCPNQLQGTVDELNAPDVVNLSWELGSYIDLTSYEISRNGTSIATVGVAATSYQDSPPAGGDLVYTLRALGPDADLCEDLTANVTIRRNPSNGLLAYFRFDGDALDSSSSSIDGTVSGEPVYTEGVFGNALSFDDRTDPHEYVNLGNPDALNFEEDGDFTVSVWVKNDDGFPDRTHLGGSANDPAIIGNKNSRLDSNIGWHIGAGTNRRWKWSFSDGSQTRTFQSGSNALSDHQWHHLIVVHDRDGLATFYQNGQQIGTRDISGIASINSNLPTAIATDGIFGGNGGSGNASFSWFHGEIDEVKIWGRSFTPAEAASLYKNDTGFMNWQMSRFTADELADDKISGTSADPDHNGLPNLLEFALSDSTSAPTPTVSVSDTGQLQITYQRWRRGYGDTGRGYTANGVVYYVEQTTDLAAESWHRTAALLEVVGEPTVITENIEEVTVRSRMTSNTPSLYLRLHVEQH